MNNTTGHAHDETAWLQLARRLQNNSFSSLANWENWPASSARWCICCSVSAGHRIFFFARAANCMRRSVGRAGRWLMSG